MNTILYDLQIGIMLEKLAAASCVIVHGVSEKSILLVEDLKDAGIKVNCFFDRNKELQGTRVCDIDVIDKKMLLGKIQLIHSDNIWMISAISNPIETMDFLNVIEIEDEQICVNLVTRWAVSFALYVNRDKVFKPGSKVVDRMKRETETKYVRCAEEKLWALRELIWLKNNVIYILQAGKVGSTSIKKMLDQNQIRNIHTHKLVFPEYFCQEDIKKVWDSATLRAGSNTKLKIITSVREPISRDFSSFWQPFSEGEGDRIKLLPLICDDLQEMYDKYSSVIIGKNLQMQLELGFLTPWTWIDEFEWFDAEIKKGLGIDIYQYDFDKDKGYQIIECDNCEIFIFKLEKLADVLPALSTYVGVNDQLEFCEDNKADDKWFSLAYQEFKKSFKITKEYFEHYYVNNNKLNHFYTENEKKEFIEKWKSHLY